MPPSLRPSLRLPRSLRLIIAALGLVLTAAASFAHETTVSYLDLTRDGATVDSRLRIAFRDLDVVLWLDADLDGTLTWQEVTARQDEIFAYRDAALVLDADGPCTVQSTALLPSTDQGLPYLDLHSVAVCASANAALTVQSRLFADIDPNHRMFLTATGGDGTSAAVLRSDGSMTTLKTGLAEIAQSYFQSGIGHLLAGPDHIAFLLLLILPTVAFARSVRSASLQMLAALTGFTLSHALTLTIATVTTISPRPLVIEVLIVLTILLTAIDNLRPFLPGPRAAAATFFGLIHGFGFASVLAGTGLTAGPFVVALGAFSLGIELAQIAVVVVVATALYQLRGGRIMVWIGSAAGIMASLGWAYKLFLAA